MVFQACADLRRSRAVLPFQDGQMIGIKKDHFFSFGFQLSEVAAIPDTGVRTSSLSRNTDRSRMPPPILPTTEPAFWVRQAVSNETAPILWQRRALQDSYQPCL